MKNRLLWLLTCLLLVSPLSADDLLLRQLDASKSYAVQKVNGKWVVTVIDQVATVSGGPGVPPITDPNSLPGKVAKWTGEINANKDTVGAFGAVIDRVLIKGVESGEIKHTDVFGGTNETGKLFSRSLDVILKEQGETAQWVPWRKNIQMDPKVGLITLTQQKKLDEKDEVIAHLKGIKAGLDGYLNSAGFLDRINWQKVVGLLKKLSDLGIFKSVPIADVIIEILDEFVNN